jgi:DNA-binding MarR family transcriptional regulator
MRNKLEHLKLYGIDVSSGKWDSPALYLIASVYAKMQNRVAKLLSQHALSVTKFNTLMLIRHLGAAQGISQQDIRTKLLVSAPNISRMINDLHKHGLVERKTDAQDRRIQRLIITKKGTDLLDRVWPEYNALMKQLGASLPAQDEHNLVEILTRFYKKLS